MPEHHTANHQAQEQHAKVVRHSYLHSRGRHAAAVYSRVANIKSATLGASTTCDIPPNLLSHLYY
jgi:hypothetical protein